MIKRILCMVLSLLLLGALCALAEPVGTAENPSAEAAPAETAPAEAAPWEMPAGGRGGRMGGGPGGMPPGENGQGGMTPPQMPEDGRNWGGNMGGMPGNMQAEENTEAAENGTVADFVREYETPLISLVLLVCAFFFVIFYKRKRY